MTTTIRPRPPARVLRRSSVVWLLLLLLGGLALAVLVGLSTAVFAYTI